MKFLGLYPRIRWPRTLQTLTLGDRFNQSLAGRSDLTQLQSLTLGKDFDQPLPAELPFLQQLILGQDTPR